MRGWLSLHAPFRAEFLAWLQESSGRFALPGRADLEAPSHTLLRVPGLHPALDVSLRGASNINIDVTWKNVFWDTVASFDVYAHPSADGAGWRNTLFIPKAQRVHPTQELCWREDGFEKLLNWFNDELAPATHLALVGGEDCYDGTDWTEAFLVRDGMILGTGRPVGSSKWLRELLPLHAIESSWSATTTGSDAVRCPVATREEPTTELSL